MILSRIIVVADGLTPHDQAFLQAVAETILTARAKYPGPRHRHVAFAAEVGEAHHATQKLITQRGTRKDLWDELVQAAAMAGRLAVEGDQDLGIEPITTTEAPECE